MFYSIWIAPGVYYSLLTWLDIINSHPGFKPVTEGLEGLEDASHFQTLVRQEASDDSWDLF